MADMMASGQVGLLLSPKWQLSSSHVYPTIGRTKGFLFYIIFITYPSDGLFSTLRQRGCGARHHPYDAFPYKTKMFMGLVRSGQVRFSV